MVIELLRLPARWMATVARQTGSGIMREGNSNFHLIT